MVIGSPVRASVWRRRSAAELRPARMDPIPRRSGTGLRAASFTGALARGTLEFDHPQARGRRTYDTGGRDTG